MGVKHGSEAAAERHPRRGREGCTPPELGIRDASGRYVALRHVIAIFAEDRLTPGHGEGWRREAAAAAGIGEGAGIDEVRWRAPSRRLDELTSRLADELHEALGPELRNGPAAAAESLPGSDQSRWRAWWTATGRLETRSADGGTDCRRRSVTTGELHGMRVEATEQEIEQWLGGGGTSRRR